ncbi:MFS transporter [Rhodococcoides kyotonense]|uniref:Predicted arabinose efflux permease, MFS family n=1 Tax=Rhodococcoides kyotonense TaxID=398843 RepID=A0A239M1Z3_9NOCA|nr:MFS transporter [Rhodococcus kyotonensis]SNT35939.1 Predicted arabinose efflux permease, MFS family [Rhodococcus kyotonensis]
MSTAAARGAVCGVALLALCTAVAQGMSRFSFGPLAPAMLGREPGVATVVGVLAMCHMLGYVIGSIATPALVRRWTSSGTVRAGVWTVTAGLALLTWSPAVSVMAAGLFATGFGAALTWIVAPNLAANLIPSQRGLAIGLISGSMGIGLITASLLAGSVPEHHWRAVWLAECMISAGISCAITRWPPRPNEPLTTTTGHTRIRAPWRVDSQWPWYTSAFAMFSFGVAMCQTFLVAGLERNNGAGGLFSHLAYGCIGVGMLFGGFAFERLSRHWGRAPTSCIQYALFATALATVLVMPHRLAILLTIVLIGATMTGTAATIIADLTDRHRTIVATLLFGTVFPFVGVGQVLGPFVGGWAVESFGYHSGFLLCAAVSALGAVPLAINTCLARRY